MPLNIRKSALAVGLAAAFAALTPPLMSAALAQQRVPQFAYNQCRIIGAISHRCYTFHSDATWREGLVDYHGDNGG
jgi:hypothetical protein